MAERKRRGKGKNGLEKMTSQTPGRSTYSSKTGISTVHRARAPSEAIQPSTCRTEKPIVAANFLHYAREPRRRRRAAQISRPVRDVTAVGVVISDSGTHHVTSHRAQRRAAQPSSVTSTSQRLRNHQKKLDRSIRVVSFTAKTNKVRSASDLSTRSNLSGGHTVSSSSRIHPPSKPKQAEQKQASPIRRQSNSTAQITPIGSVWFD